MHVNNVTINKKPTSCDVLSSCQFINTMSTCHIWSMELHSKSQVSTAESMTNASK